VERKQKFFLGMIIILQEHRAKNKKSANFAFGIKSVKKYNLGSITDILIVQG